MYRTYCMMYYLDLQCTYRFRGIYSPPSLDYLFQLVHEWESQSMPTSLYAPPLLVLVSGEIANFGKLSRGKEINLYMSGTISVCLSVYTCHPTKYAL